MTSSGWVTLKNNHGTVGTVWVEDGSLEFAGDPEPGTSATAERVFGLVASSNELGVDPDQAIKIVVDSAKKYDQHLTVLDGGENEALVAAATQASEDYVYKEESPYTLTVDGNDNVLGLVWIDENGAVSVRENMEWNTPSEDDERFYNNNFYFVTQNAVQLYDRLVQDGNTPVLDDFDEVSVD